MRTAWRMGEQEHEEWMQLHVTAEQQPLIRVQETQVRIHTTLRAPVIGGGPHDHTVNQMKAHGVLGIHGSRCPCNGMEFWFYLIGESHPLFRMQAQTDSNNSCLGSRSLAHFLYSSLPSRMLSNTPQQALDRLWQQYTHLKTTERK